MDTTQAYTLLFVDSLFAEIIFSSGNEFAMESMLSFGSYNKYLIFFIRILAFTTSIAINYIFGWIVCNILLYKPNENNYKRYDNLQIFTKKYKILLLLLAALPFYGRFIMVYYGFCKEKIIPWFLISIISKIIILQVL